jgi:hypothetical protein
VLPHLPGRQPFPSRFSSLTDGTTGLWTAWALAASQRDLAVTQEDIGTTSQVHMQGTERHLPQQLLEVRDTLADGCLSGKR